jgi:hypothetical protein
VNAYGVRKFGDCHPRVSCNYVLMVSVTFLEKGQRHEFGITTDHTDTTDFCFVGITVATMRALAYFSYLF